jgi:enoyl-CoA hydratase/carnithine racemase
MGIIVSVGFVRVTDERDVRTITLDRPERLNALGAELLASLEDVVADTASRPARVVVIEGAGRVFSAGADLKDAPAPPETWQQRRRESGRWHRLLDAIESLPQVTVGRVHGAVIGGAVLLAASCDLRVAAAGSYFQIPELAIGIPLTWGGNPRLVREIGIARAREMVLTGRRVEAPEALAWGLVHRIADDGIVEELLAMPAGPLAMTKDAFRALGRTVVSHEVAWADADLLSSARREPESADAARSYVERTIRRTR